MIQASIHRRAGSAVRRASRSTALLLAASLAAPVLIGCGGRNQSGANLPPVDETQGGRVSYTPSAGGQNPASNPPAHTGLSTKQKVMLVAGAAALYYLYRKHQHAQGQGQEGQYYLSKNGRVYYPTSPGAPTG